MYIKLVFQFFFSRIKLVVSIYIRNFGHRVGKSNQVVRYLHYQAWFRMSGCLDLETVLYFFVIIIIISSSNSTITIIPVGRVHV